MLRVLIVDDCPMSQRLTASTLGRLGIASEPARDGAVALLALAAERFDAVLMDCEMPVLDGYEATRRVRAGACGAERSGIIIAACSADTGDAHLVRCLEAGMTARLHKPLVPEELSVLLAPLARTRELPTEGTGAAPPRRISFDADQFLARLMGDCRLADEVLAHFVNELPSQVAELHRAIAGSDRSQTLSLAHRLKGSAGMIGEPNLHRIAGEIEAASDRGKPATLDRLMSRLESVACGVLESLRCVRLSGTPFDQTSALRSADGEPPASAASPGARSSRVLIVEDNPAQRSILSMLLHRQGHAVSVATDAAEARELLQGCGFGTFDCVLTDYRMRGETGVELLTWLRWHDPNLSGILQTADASREIATEALRIGAFDILDKHADAARLDSSVAAAITRTRQLRRTHLMEREVREVGRAHLQMLEAQSSRDLPVQVCYYPRTDVGGDFFSSFRLDTGCEVCMLTDVSGHDLQAGYLSTYFHGMVRGMLERQTPPIDVFRSFNRFLIREWNTGDARHPTSQELASLSVAAVVIDPGRGTICALTAGAPAPTRVTGDGRISLVGRRGGFPLGWFAQVDEQKEEVSLEGGGALIFWSDGLDLCARAQDVSLFSVAYLAHLSREAGRRHPLLESADDDVLVAWYPLAPDAGVFDSFFPLVMWTYPGDQRAEIDASVEFWRRSLRLAIPDMSPTSEHDILLGAREALLNGLVHGCRGRADLAARVQICFRRSDSTVRVRVDDPGEGHRFDAAAYGECAARQLLTEHRGLILIHLIASGVRYERNGASIIMDFRCQ